MTPATLKPPPARMNIIAVETRVNRGTSSKGAIKEIPHMAAAIKTATAGGGILSSSDFMRMPHHIVSYLSRTSPRQTTNNAFKDNKIGRLDYS